MVFSQIASVSLQEQEAIRNQSFEDTENNQIKILNEKINILETNL